MSQADVNRQRSALETVLTEHQKLSKETIPLFERQLNEQRTLIDGEKARTDQLMADLAESQRELKEARDTLKELEAREQRPGAKRTVVGWRQGPRDMAREIAKQVAESKAYEHWNRTAQASNQPSIPIKVPSLFPTEASQGEAREQRSASFGFDPTNVPIADPLRLDGLVTPPRRTPILRQIMQVLSLSDEHLTQGVEYDEETADYKFYTQVKTSQTSGNNTIVLKNISGLSNVAPFNTINLDGTDYTIQTVGTQADDGSGTLTLTANLSANVDANTVAYANRYVFQAEGGHGVQTQDKYTTKTAPAGRILSYIEATLERLMVKAWMQRQIERRLPEKQREVEEDLQFYAPFGVSGRPSGLMKNTNIPLKSLASLGANYGPLDLILEMIGSVDDNRHMATHVLAPGKVMRQLAREKGTDKQYILSMVFFGGISVLWQTPAVKARALMDYDCIAGDFEMGADLYARDNAQVEIGTTGIQLREGWRTITYWDYYAMPVSHPLAFCRGDSTPT